jgi:V/A-type H+-transporting ATPase subunit D
MKRKVNATRMELLRVRKRLDLAVRGHKLLKDKLEGLIRELTARLQEYKDLRIAVDRRWPRIYQGFLLADALSSSTATEAAVRQARPRAQITTRDARVMGVQITDARAEVAPSAAGYSLVQTSAHLDEAVRELRDFLPELVRLAGLEQTVRALAAEVQKTRRRANALEYVLIPDLRAARKTISGRLEEITRSDVSRLMKVKEMLVAREAETT